MSLVGKRFRPARYPGLMRKLTPLLNPPAIGDRVDGFDPEGSDAVRVAAFLPPDSTGRADLTIFRSVLPDLWSMVPDARLIADNSGRIVHVDVPVTDEREVFVVVSASGEPPPGLEVFAAEIRRPAAARPAGAGWAAEEMLSDVRQVLGRFRGVGETLPETLRRLADDFGALVLLKEELARKVGAPVDAHPRDVADAVFSVLDKPSTRRPPLTGSAVPPPPAKPAAPTLPDMSAPPPGPAGGAPQADPAATAAAPPQGAGVVI